MKELMLKYKDKASETWSGLSNKQKYLVIGIIALVILSLVLLTYWATQPEYTVIYTNLSEVEAGEIVQEIESRGIPVQLSEDGRRISVPKTEAIKLKLDLAHAGIPRSGNINYGIFSENMGFGMTDNQFNVVRLDAMQSELRYLIEQIDGIDRAQVMLSLPERSIWVADDTQLASASIVVHVRPGMELSQTQINGLYHIISKSVPDLPVENIGIMNHHMQYLEMVDEGAVDTTLAVYQQQRQVRREIERDIQRELQQMLGTILGMDKVIVSVHASIDFARERREEHLVEPVDELTNEGIAISIERIQESFYGEGSPVGGIPGTGEGDIAGYQGVDGGQNNEYERLEERINHEVNRIYREIELSPYVIEDLTINVGVEPPNPEEPTSLSAQDVEDIRAILRSVVRTYLSASSQDISEADMIDQKVTVFANEFRGRPDYTVAESEGIPATWLYILGAVALLIIGLLIFALIRRNRRQEEIDEAEDAVPLSTQFEDYDYNFEQENEETARRKRIERLARNQPEEFVKLLRTWLADE